MGKLPGLRGTAIIPWAQGSAGCCPSTVKIPGGSLVVIEQTRSLGHQAAEKKKKKNGARLVLCD